MKPIYNKIWKLAKPSYLKGRPYDVEHIKWLMKVVPKFLKDSELDMEILLPLVILHDVGYCKVKINAMKLEVRKAHMEEGAKIAKEILEKIDYPKEKADEICRLISKHDNWAFGDSFGTELYLQAFNNFDRMWVVNKKGFISFQKLLNLDPAKTIRKIEEDRKLDIKEGRIWVNKKVEEYYIKLLNKRKKENEKGFLL